MQNQNNMAFDSQSGEFEFKNWEIQQVVSDLSPLLPADSLLHHQAQLISFECDGLSAYRKIPKMVVLPETIEQCQQIVRYCHKNAIPLIARGAGTGLAGGVLPVEQSIVMGLSKFNRIKSIDPLQRLAVVEPGVRNLAITEAATQYGLYYAPDPSSQIACSIGGNVAENSGGVHSLKYGLTVNNVMGIKMLDSEGELIEIGGQQCMDSPGYDILALMHGSEGLLGIIMEVTVRLVPKPQAAQVVLAAFNDVSNAGAAVRDIISAGIIPAGLEMMDRLAIQAAEDFVHADYPICEALLLCELDGTLAEIEQQMSEVKHILQQCSSHDIRLSQNDKQRALFWAGRKAAFPAVGRISPDYYCMDGTIPRKALPDVLKSIAEFSTQYGLPVANVFHAGDGNLHPLILYDANKPGDLDKAEALGGDILRLCVDKGGTITGEHGVGVEKIDHMCHQFTSPELIQFHRIKAQLDPQGILNPGKAIPSLHRCAELGAMHVHNGQLAHPDIPRF
jgi:glycolate oxidase